MSSERVERCANLELSITFVGGILDLTLPQAAQRLVVARNVVCAANGGANRIEWRRDSVDMDRASIDWHELFRAPPVFAPDMSCESIGDHECATHLSVERVACNVRRRNGARIDQLLRNVGLS